jgi:ankyrin repeat protein
LLHHKKVDVNCRDKKGITALFIASFSDKLGVVQLLLQHEELKVNLQNGLGQTALWAACACGNSKIIRTLLRDKRVNVNVKTMKGSTALNVAILKGYDNVVRLLKEHTARVPAVDESWVPRESELNLMDSGRSNFLLSTNVMDVHLSTTHGSMDRKPRTIGVSERTTTPLPPNQQLIRAALDGKLQGADIHVTDDIGETERALMNDNVDVNRPTDESHSMDCDGRSISSSQIQEFEVEIFSHRKKLRTDITDVHLSTAHGSMDQKPRTIDANERTVAPPHQVAEVLDNDVTDNDVSVVPSQMNCELGN